MSAIELLRLTVAVLTALLVGFLVTVALTYSAGDAFFYIALWIGAVVAAIVNLALGWRWTR